MILAQELHIADGKRNSFEAVCQYLLCRTWLREYTGRTINMLRRNLNLFRLIGFVGVFIVGIVAAGWGGCIPQAWADSGGLIVLSDEELSQVSGGDFTTTLEDLNISIQRNSASEFTMDISEFAFQNAQGVFTTLQTVNSAVNLNMIVNIYLNERASL